MERPAKFRIYRDVLCLEMADEHNIGAKFWDQGFDLSYTPAKVQKITKVQYGLVRGSGTSAGRWILAAWYEGQWVAVNLPRSDIGALIARGMWPKKLATPYDVCDYSTLPVRI